METVGPIRPIPPLLDQQTPGRCQTPETPENLVDLPKENLEKRNIEEQVMGFNNQKKPGKNQEKLPKLHDFFHQFSWLVADVVAAKKMMMVLNSRREVKVSLSEHLERVQ